MKVTILGCGSSGGVPYIGCDCATCASSDLKNTRTRVSIHVEHAGKSLLVDTSPDLRQQALAHQIHAVDAILYTHAHADHCHGIDDVRMFNYNRQGKIDAYADAETLAQLRARFGYVFQPPKPEWGWYKPYLQPHTITPEVAFDAAGMHILPILQFHGKSNTMGYRIGDFAYSTDVNKFPNNSMQALENLDVWVVDCLRDTPAPTHAHLEMTLGWIAELKPKLAVLTHMGHELEYHALRKRLPEGVVPAYDGMQCVLS
jgi:phosphoribosyl 1,2-cyclic phosphate phosphodiesterase